MIKKLLIVILGIVLAVGGSYLIGLFWTNALIDQDAATIMSFISGAPLGIMIIGICSALWPQDRW